MSSVPSTYRGRPEARPEQHQMLEASRMWWYESTGGQCVWHLIPDVAVRIGHSQKARIPPLIRLPPAPLRDLLCYESRRDTLLLLLLLHYLASRRRTTASLLAFCALHLSISRDRKSTRLNSSHITRSRMPSSA